MLVVLLAVALLATPLVRTLDTAHGTRSVTVSARTATLGTRMWIARRGGRTVAHADGTVSCATRAGSGEDEMFGFDLNPSSSQTVWRHVRRGGDCLVSVTVRGPGLLRVSLRGY